MKIKVQILIESDENNVTAIEEIACIERKNLSPETLGLTLQEGKNILKNLQSTMISNQVEEHIAQNKNCWECGKECNLKDSKNKITYRTPFGKLKISSPRFYKCACDSIKGESFSPIAKLLPERTSPELLYLQSKWSSLMSYGMTVDLLEEILPLNTNVASTLLNSRKIAERIESALEEEKPMFIDGCINEWEKLPFPDEPLSVGIDGGYIYGREGENRKAGHFEVIVGKSMQEGSDNKRFGFVNNYDKKPKRRLYDMLMSQGFQMNQTITFLSDGGDTVRDLQFYMSPNAEHILDWFHVTMRITVMKQMAKGIPKNESLKNLEKDIDGVKWYLWHGNVFNALQRLENIEDDLNCVDEPKALKLYNTVNEFYGYIENNRNLIPNYQDRHQYGECISTAFVESTVNEVISKRMRKKQQMRWTQKGAHLLLQLRTKTLNNELEGNFQNWYPEFRAGDKINKNVA
ncbi:MAG: ISKra4 family transposase [Candidatus Sericytochromatia bacterium]